MLAFLRSITTVLLVLFVMVKSSPQPRKLKQLGDSHAEIIQRVLVVLKGKEKVLVGPHYRRPRPCRLIVDTRPGVGTVAFYLHALLNADRH